ncbi:TPA: hypothetical protein RQO17_005347 [Klebsiella michiganensis]|uniref:hypothetical protein n=1 Tax=Klebsiella TaxID=570 RepID=UPI00111540E0|nr:MULTISPECIES: hypothetical protein [Klebsiella]MBZ6572446.1 hypothetical protein [Klebsiella grimontii]MBZ7379188.1 hypothetical protein [Klebsiella grimontii]HDX8756930.1 hypothetical protein [Klebsiella michiganensis]
MLLAEYIDKAYGNTRGNRSRFLKENPEILFPELCRWLKAGLKIRPATGEIYKPVSRRVRVPDDSSVIICGELPENLCERIASLAAARNITSDEMLRFLVDVEESRNGCEYDGCR